MYGNKKSSTKKTVAKGAKPGKAAPKAQAKGPAAKKAPIQMLKNQRHRQ
jgi:hypothetical protein